MILIKMVICFTHINISYALFLYVKPIFLPCIKAQMTLYGTFDNHFSADDAF